MNRSIVSSRPAAMLRIISVAAIVSMTCGCAYFHPAFVTQPSRLQAEAPEGVLVCERFSVRRERCARIPRMELDRVMNEALARY